MGVASQFADFAGRYARDKGYGLNKRLNAILLNTVMAIQEIPVEHSKGDNKKRRDYRRHYVIVLLKEDCSSKTIDLLQ